MELQLSPHIWLEPFRDGVQVCNAVVGRKVELTKDEWKTVLAGERLSFLQPELCESGILVDPDRYRKLLADRGSPIVKALSRDLGTDSAKEALDHCRKQADSCSREVRRDLYSLLATVETFFQEAEKPLVSQPATCEFLAALGSRPPTDDQFGQLPCLPETTARRVERGLARSVPQNSACLVLGDDDLVSLEWSYRHPGPCHVLELDGQILNFLEHQNRPNLETYQQDLTKGLPERFHSKYDTVFTDPPYGRQGMDLFLRCCAQALSASPQATLFLTTRPDLIEDGEELEKRLLSLNLAVVKSTPHFSRYLLPDALRRKIRRVLSGTPLPAGLIRKLLTTPLYYADLLEVKRIG